MQLVCSVKPRSNRVTAIGLPETRQLSGTSLATAGGEGGEVSMLDRDKLETILTRRFPNATRDQIAVSANAIMGLGDEWEEVPWTDFEALEKQHADGHEFRVLRRRGL